MSQKFREQVKLLECLQLFRFGTHAAQFASVVRVHKPNVIIQLQG